MINVKFEDGINDLITENLYQWDTYQTLKISGISFGTVSPTVHFANKKSIEALVVRGNLLGDGTVEVSIPNSLLTEKYDILAYVYANTGVTYKTIKSITIPVIGRLKPSEYSQPSDDDIARIEAIELEAKSIIDRLYGSTYSSTATYQRPNIVYYGYNGYMCNSATPITNVPPTDTSKWQKICEGVVVTSVSKDSNGNLVFIFSNGSTFNVDMSVREVEMVDDNDIPALALTSEEVTKVKNAKCLGLTQTQVNNISKLVLSECDKDTSSGNYLVLYPGLYDIKVSNSANGYLVSVQAIAKFTLNLFGTVNLSLEEVNPDIGLYGFVLRNQTGGLYTASTIDKVTTLVRY